MFHLPSRFKKILGATGATGTLGFVGTAKAIGFGMVVLIACVVIIAIAIVLLLKRLMDIPEPDRERQITHAPMSNGDEFWKWYTNNGCPAPPSFFYVDGVDQVPMSPFDTHPLTNNGTVYNYFEMVLVEPPKPHDVFVCMRLGGGWTNLGTVGEGINQSGFTNQDLEVWSAAGQWNIQPTKYALTNYPSMFWTAIPKNP